MARKAATRARARSSSDELKALFELADRGKPGVLGDRCSRMMDLLLSPEHSVRVQAERLLLEQQYGKPRQAVEHTGGEGKPLFPDDARKRLTELLGLGAEKAGHGSKPSSGGVN